MRPREHRKCYRFFRVRIHTQHIAHVHGDRSQEATQMINQRWITRAAAGQDNFVHALGCDPAFNGIRNRARRQHIQCCY